MTKRTPPSEPEIQLPAGAHAMRRGGTRREATERVTLRCEDGTILEGWALNVSRGGLRVILEEKVLLAQKFGVTIGADDTIVASRVVWVQEEPDGVIVGLEFTGLSGTHKAAAAPDEVELGVAASSPPTPKAGE